MYPLTERCKALRQRVTTPNAYEEFYCMQHRVHSALGMREAKKNGLSNTESLAAGIANVLNKFMPVIQPGELIVGFNFADSKYSEYFAPEDTENDRLLAEKNGISTEDIETYFEYRKHPADLFGWQSPSLTKEEQEAQREWAAIGRAIAENHSVLGYEKVLKLGFRGLLDEVLAFEKENGANELYNAAKAICTAACRMGQKYAQAAKDLLASGDPLYSAEDLEKIIRTCENVPEKPASNFHEAVQALWFAHIINTWEDHINANSLGRLDQILYPYYKADIEQGLLTSEEAFELICCLWLKLYLHYDVQQSCVGGTDAQGRSQVNDLSYMMLDATEQLDIIRCMSVRYSKNTEKEFLQRALEVVGRVQKGVPFFFNDDTMIPALVSKGVSFEDACGYTQIGCVETIIPGKSNPHAVTGETNLLKALEYALCGGASLLYPDLRPGADTGSHEQFDTYESFYEAVKKQIFTILDLTCSSVSKHIVCAVNNCPRPYKSLLTEGCLASGRDFNNAGAKYDYYQVMLGGVPNLADSLAVIRKFVYEDRRYTLTELKDILANDFPDEKVRLAFINKAPKFGNDIDSVDDIAADIIRVSCDYLDTLSEKYGL
ncbi:MAG: pyruvate formate lyase family protein, partial [Clostridia bacterium]|nr:pyruvate formate lyase family protein [Clostridia bacterium]